MAVIKISNSHSSLKNVINYVTKKEKTTKKLVSGINCSPECAYTEMQTTKELYSKTGGRTYKHVIQSFPPNEKVSAETAHKLAVEFAQQCPLFNGYEVLIATHVDRQHIHTHLIVNSVSFESGKKFQMSAEDLQDMKDLSDSFCRKYNLSICEKGKNIHGEKRNTLTSDNMRKYQFLARADGKKVKSYIQSAAVAVADSLETSSTKEAFIQSMREKGFSVDWQDKHKYITFTDSEGNKVRNSNLQKTYGMEISKEELTKRFKKMEYIKEKHQNRHSRKR